MRPAVRAVSLSKFYGMHWSPRGLLRQVITGKETAHRIRALEGVSFRVEAGQALGVVGRNGSGKTTLLKMVSGAAHPSSGRVEVDGRIGALLDLGAGFHPEFSGRENIRFSGALMGLEPDRVRKAEDRIVAFSELREFIDQPMRTYSAGMYVRLGFAVSTGFHPSVLVIDEALAVGDQPFQKKCTDRILSIKKRGAAIVICSHNLYQIKTLCEEAIWLRGGRPQSQGDAVTVVEDYGRYLGQASSPRDGGADDAGSDPSLNCRIESLRLQNGSGSGCQSFRTGETLRLEIAAEFASDFRGTAQPSGGDPERRRPSPSTKPGPAALKSCSLWAAAVTGGGSRCGRFRSWRVGIGFWLPRALIRRSRSRGAGGLFRSACAPGDGSWGRSGWSIVGAAVSDRRTPRRGGFQPPILPFLRGMGDKTVPSYAPSCEDFR